MVSGTRRGGDRGGVRGLGAQGVEVDGDATAVARRRPGRRPPRRDTERPSLAHTSCSTGSVPRGTNCGPRRVVDARGRPACPARATRSRSPMPIASAPADVSRASPSCAVIDDGSPARSRSRPTNSAAARRTSIGVAGVLGVAPERQPPAPAPELGVAAGGGDALGQPQVGPRAGRDRRVGAHARRRARRRRGARRGPPARAGPSTPRRSRWTNGRRPGAREVARGVAGRRRDVEREPGAPAAGQLARAGDELVAHQVVADEGDPSLDQTAGREPVEQGGLAAASTSAAGAANGPSSTSQPHGRSCPASRPPPNAGGDPVGMRHGARLDRGRDAVGDRLDAATAWPHSSSSSAVWAACTGTAHPKIASRERCRRGCTSAPAGRRSGAGGR